MFLLFFSFITNFIRAWDVKVLLEATVPPTLSIASNSKNIVKPMGRVDGSSRQTKKDGKLQLVFVILWPSARNNEACLQYSRKKKNSIKNVNKNIKKKQFLFSFAKKNRWTRQYRSFPRNVLAQILNLHCFAYFLLKIIFAFLFLHN